MKIAQSCYLFQQCSTHTGRFLWYTVIIKARIDAKDMVGRLHYLTKDVNLHNIAANQYAGIDRFHHDYINDNKIEHNAQVVNDKLSTKTPFLQQPIKFCGYDAGTKPLHRLFPSAVHGGMTQTQTI
ncbi:MAG: hypothetical protein RSF70_04525 [Ruthenibacterium sp.]